MSVKLITVEIKVFLYLFVVKIGIKLMKSLIKLLIVS